MAISNLAQSLLPVHQGIGDPDRHPQRGGQGQGAARGRGPHW